MLFRAEESVACVAETGNYVSVVVQVAVNCGSVYVNIRMLLMERSYAFRSRKQ